MKACTKCGIAKPTSGFGSNPKGRFGVHSNCKSCQSATHKARYRSDEAYRTRFRVNEMLRRYGLTVEQRDDLRASQNGACAVCTSPLLGGNREHIDHDHDTGKIRGILCSECNTGIGKLGDNVAGLERALAYLKRT